MDEKIREIKYKLARALAAKRQELKSTQSQFAEFAGIHHQRYVSEIENGKLDQYSIEFLLKANLRAKTGLKLFDALT